MKKLLLLILLISVGCSSVRLSTLNHEPQDIIVLKVPNTVKIDTLTYSRLSWKIRTDFRFRWDYAQFAMNQPYSFYTDPFIYRFWKPLRPFDAYWNRNQIWYDWAFGFNSGWSWYSYRPWFYNSYNHWNNKAIMKGRRGGVAYNNVDRVDVIAERIQKKINLNNNKSTRVYNRPEKNNWDNKNKFVPRENPGNNISINNPRTSFESKDISRVDVNRTKIKMKQ